MKYFVATGFRRMGLIAPVAAAILLTAGPSIASSGPPTLTASSAVTRAFAFIGKPNSKTSTIVNIDKLLINARCNAQGAPVVFAFSSATNADLFGRLFDGSGRVHIIRNSSFTKKATPKGMLISPSTNDFDTTGIVMFETTAGDVVTVNYTVDNATTLGKLNVCTVYGTLVAS